MMDIVEAFTIRHSGIDKIDHLFQTCRQLKLLEQPKAMQEQAMSTREETKKICFSTL